MADIFSVIALGNCRYVANYNRCQSFCFPLEPVCAKAPAKRGLHMCSKPSKEKWSVTYLVPCWQHAVPVPREHLSPISPGLWHIQQDHSAIQSLGCEWRRLKPCLGCWQHCGSWVRHPRGRPASKWQGVKRRKVLPWLKWASVGSVGGKRVTNWLVVTSELVSV